MFVYNDFLLEHPPHHALAHIQLNCLFHYVTVFQSVNI